MTDDDALGLSCVLAPNASVLTGEGTNTYILGREHPCVIDPGPDDPRHLASILAALEGRTPSHILITHGHADHMALAPCLADLTGAPVLWRGDSTLGLNIDGNGWRLAVLPTPGHTPDHACFDWPETGLLFTGDHVLGPTSTMVAPPDGHMGDYLASLASLESLRARRLLPGHGPPVADGQERIAQLLAHRLNRRAQVLAALTGGPATASAIASALQPTLGPALAQAAALTILAHLIELRDSSHVMTDDPVTLAAQWRLA